MPETFFGLAAYVVALAIVGLLILTFVRWRPGASSDASPARVSAFPPPLRGRGCAVVLGLVVLIVIVVLLWLWAIVAARP